MISIDGSHGEGGGQIIRTSLTLAAITQKPVSISNIRAGRSPPGLKMQHITAAKAVRSICRGTLENADLGSTSLVFNPGKIVGGKYDLNVGTAGSVTLVAQTIIPILLSADKPSTVRIQGGTHVMASPSYEYFEKVFLPAIQIMGARVQCKIFKPGFYPTGGGEIEITVKPSDLRGVEVWPSGSEEQVIITLSDLPISIAMREKKIFLQEGIENVHIRQDKAIDKGNSVFVWKGLRGAYSLGKLGVRAEEVAQRALDEINKEQFDIDLHLADQLLVYASLAVGKTRYRTSEISEHLKTNAEIIRKFVDRNINMQKNEVSII